MIYKDKNSTFEELFNRNTSISIHHQNVQKLGIKIFKFVKGLNPVILKETFQFIEECHYQLRSKAWLLILLFPTVFQGTETKRFLGPIIWKFIPNELQQL